MNASIAAQAAPERLIGTEEISFDGGGAFYGELKQRVRDHTTDPVNQRRAQRQLYVKTAIVFAWTIASWALLVFAANTWWQALPLIVSLGLAVAAIGFNVTHDANHGAYSSNRRLNRAMRWSLDAIGASSYVWRVKHNVVHHTFTNISGADSDIEQLPFLRLAPDQPRRWFHRGQHVFAWFLYGVFAIKWHLFSDATLIIKGDIAGTPLPRPKGKDLAGLILWKVVFFGWTIAIPLMFHSWQAVLIGFVGASAVLAITIALTFQLAHCVEEADFPSVRDMSEQGRTEWARHQVETTVDFAPRSRLLAWYMGGLNFQIEHHLFTKIPHTHYPQVAPIVREVCEKHGVRYQVHHSLGSAIASHARWLRRMGRKVTATRPPVAPAA